MLIRYIRDKKGELKGCVVRTDEGRLGYSLCHKLDKLKNTKKMTRQIAIDRAAKIEIRQVNTDPAPVLISFRHEEKLRRIIPHTVQPYLKELMKISDDQ